MKKIFAFALFLIMLTDVSAGEFTMTDVRIVSASPAEKFVVVRFGGRETRIIRVGEKVTDQVTLTEIGEDAVIFENRNAQNELIIIRLENGSQRIVRIRKQIEEELIFYRSYNVQGE